MIWQKKLNENLRRKLYRSSKQDNDAGYFEVDGLEDVYLCYSAREFRDKSIMEITIWIDLSDGEGKKYYKLDTFEVYFDGDDEKYEYIGLEEHGDNVVHEEFMNRIELLKIPEKFRSRYNPVS